MDPAADHRVHGSALPLWCHVSNTLDGVEIKTFSLLSESLHLTVLHPRAPFISHFPVELVDPLFGPVRGNSTVSVSRVDHDAVAILEERVDPVRGSWEHTVLNVRAHLPGCSIRWDVESLSGLWPVHEDRDEVTDEELHRRVVVGNLSLPWGVLFHRHSPLESLDLAINDGFSNTVLWR